MADFKEYEKNGIYIAYPENWTLQEENMESKNGSLMLNSPQGAFWILRRHPLGTDKDELAGEVLRTMREQYDELEFEKIDRKINGFDVTGFEMNFYSLDWTCTAMVYCFEHGDSLYALFRQSGDQMIITGNEDSIPLEKVLEAISFSMMQRLKNER